MEKTLWTAVAVLWISLLASVACAAGGRDVVNRGTADGVANGLVVQTASLTSPAGLSFRNITPDRMVRPVVEFGQQGSGELAGAALIGAGFVFRALRRRGLV